MAVKKEEIVFTIEKTEAAINFFRYVLLNTRIYFGLLLSTKDDELIKPWSDLGICDVTYGTDIEKILNTGSDGTEFNFTIHNVITSYYLADITAKYKLNNLSEIMDGLLKKTKLGIDSESQRKAVMTNCENHIAHLNETFKTNALFVKAAEAIQQIYPIDFDGTITITVKTTKKNQ